MANNKENEIATLIRGKREEKGLTLAAVSKLTGISPRSLAGLERGERPASPAMVVKVMEALGLARKEPNTSDIGGFVRTRRQANSMTQRELGELAGVGLRFVSELERGKASMRLDVVNKVLAVFGKTLGITEASKRNEHNEES